MSFLVPVPLHTSLRRPTVTIMTLSNDGAPHSAAVAACALGRPLRSDSFRHSKIPTFRASSRAASTTGRATPTSTARAAARPDVGVVKGLPDDKDPALPDENQLQVLMRTSPASY